MRSIYTYIFASVAIITAVLVAGCTKAPVHQDSSLAMVTLKISDGTKAGTEDNILSNEGLKTLRVIVSAGEKNIVRNEKFAIAQNSDGTAVTSTELTLYDLPRTAMKIYLIANEESINAEYTTETILKELENTTKILHVDANNEYFPIRRSHTNEYGLPMTGTGDLTIPEGSKHASVEITLTRIVVKLNLTVENATSESITMTNIKYGSFCGDRVFLFKGGAGSPGIDVPEGIVYKEFQFSGATETILGGTIESMEKGTYTAYIYPTYAFTSGLDNPYTIQLSTAKGDYGELVFGKDNHGNDLNSFPRNTQVNINARITSEANISLNFEVSGWGEPITIDVPPFNQPAL